MKDPCKKCVVRAACTIGCTPHDKFQEHLGQLTGVKLRIKSTWSDTKEAVAVMLAPLVFILTLLDIAFHATKYFLAKNHVIDLEKKKRRSHQ